MTYLQLLEKIKRLVWPEGIARNLVEQFRQDMLTCLIDLQQNVKMLQIGQTTETDFGATFWKCGATWLYIPPLVRFTKVEIYDNPDDDAKPCCIQRADPISANQMECQQQTCRDLEPPAGSPNSDGFYTPDPDLDPAVDPGRYETAIINGNLAIWPAIPSTKAVRYSYSGVKRAWADDDVMPDLWMPDGQIDPEIVDYIEWFLRRIKQRCSPNDLLIANAEFVRRRQKMMSDLARDEKWRLDIRRPCAITCQTYC